MESIKNFNVYNEEMAKSWYEKIGFVDHIFQHIDIVVDFGCADGSIAQFIHKVYKDAKVIGYDTKEVFDSNGIEEGEDENGILFTSSLDKIREIMSGARRKTSLLVLNSVLHEVYNYMGHADARSLLDSLFGLYFNYVWIRDIFIVGAHGAVEDEDEWYKRRGCIAETLNRLVEEDSGDDRLDDVLGASTPFMQMLQYYRIKWCEPESEDGMAWFGLEEVSEKESPTQVSGKTFDRMLDGVCALVEYIMKRHYVDNWEREKVENYNECTKYLTSDLDLRCGGIESMKYYDIKHERRYIMPYLEHAAYDELRLNLKELVACTHIEQLYWCFAPTD